MSGNLIIRGEVWKKYFYDDILFKYFLNYLRKIYYRYFSIRYKYLRSFPIKWPKNLLSFLLCSFSTDNVLENDGYKMQ